MPKGPSGQKRKADVIGNAVLVMKIATGEAKETEKAKTVAEKAGSKGGKTRAAKLTPKQRQSISQKAASARWKKHQ